MGYILPIPQYQYDDYRERIQRNKRDPFPIEKLYRVNLEEKMKQHEPAEEDHKEYQGHFSSKLYTPNHIHAGKTEKIYADVTGKGRLFNESI